MAKKEKIQLNRSNDMEAIDAELNAAMEALDLKTQEVAGLLAACDVVAPSEVPQEGAAAFAELSEPDASEPQPPGDKAELN